MMKEGVPYAGVYRAPTSSTTPIVFGMVTTDRGDVVALLDTDGDPFAAYRYDPWGKPTTTVTQATTLIGSSLAAEIAARQVLRYAGYVYDADIGTSACGTYYLSARQYDPMTRQFLSRDPLKADGEESSYQYCGGEPASSVDPSGCHSVTYTWRITNIRFVAYTYAFRGWKVSAWGPVTLKISLQVRKSNTVSVNVSVSYSIISAALGYNVTASTSVSVAGSYAVKKGKYRWLGYSDVYAKRAFTVQRLRHVNGKTTVLSSTPGSAKKWLRYEINKASTAGPSRVPASPH